MNWIVANLPFVLCVLFGMLLLIIEIAVPGFGIPGLLGILFSIASIIICSIEFGPLAAIGLAIVMGTIIALVISTSLKSLKSGKLSKKIALTSDLEDIQAVDIDENLIGQTGVTLSELRPTGIARVGEKRLDVVSDGEFIDRGVKIYVDSIENLKIIVKKL